MDYKLSTGNTSYVQSRKSVSYWPSSLSTFTGTTSRVCRIPITSGMDFLDPESVKLALTPYALAADLAAAEGSIVANASGLVAVNTSLTLGLASKANQSALDALQVEVNGKSTPTNLASNWPTTPPRQQ